MDKWEGAVAVVTGASAGIGQAIAVQLAEHGMIVAALARRDDRLKELAANFRGKGSIRGYKCDVTRDSDIEDVFGRIEKDIGRIRVLVNNAGVALQTNITEFNFDKWRQMFNVNFFGLSACTKYVIHSARENNDENLFHIININSIAGHQPPSFPGVEIYSMTKHCVTTITKSLIKELGLQKLTNIKLTSVSPGAVKTEIFDVGGWKELDLTKISNLSPNDIAKGVLAALAFDKHIQISELTIKPVGEVF